MKKLWIFLLMPVLAFAYPIYEEDVPLPEQLAREAPVSEKEPLADEEGRGSRQSAESKKRSILRDQRMAKTEGVPKSSIETRKSAILSRSSPPKKNSTSKWHKKRQNPNRPRVTHRDEKQPQNLSKVEADANEIEEGLSTHKDEREPSQKKGSAQKKKGVNSRSSKALPSTKKEQGSYSGKRPTD